MEKKKIISLLQSVYNRKLDAGQAFEKLKHLPYEDLGFAKLDHHRPLRKGLPEVIFCQGKTTEQVLEIFRRLFKRNSFVLMTRAEKEVFKKVAKIAPKAHYNNLSRTIAVLKKPLLKKGKVSVVSAGTSDIPVAEEAVVTAEVFGSKVDRYYDVGVAGLHRLLDCFSKISDSRCIIVVAGMDAALASVLGGLSACPVIAVPTSVGYGAHFEGLASLLAMLNSCASGVACVNIDNGFGAGYLAALINGVQR